MSKHNKSQDNSGSDDISGLFERFGAGADVARYQPFTHPELPQRARPPRPSAEQVPPPVPAPAPALAPAPVPAPAPAVAAAPAPLHRLRPVETGAAAEPVPAADTPLARLFQRLLQDGASVRDVGPLRRLFPR